MGSAVNVLLTLFKFAAGIVGHSSAMIADAVHSLSDLVSDAVVVVFVRISGKPEDADHAFGHGKYETLATVIIGLLLLAVGVGLLVDGLVNCLRFINGEEIEAPNWWALGAAVISLVAKEVLFRYTMRMAHRIKSPVLEANAWHHRSDAYTSVATLVGIGGAMLLEERWRILDPLAAAVVSLFIIIEAVRLMRPALGQLLDHSLLPGEIDQIDATVRRTPGIVSYHRLRTRRVGNAAAISMHIKMPGDISLNQAHAIATDLETELKKQFGPDTITTIHMEPSKNQPQGAGH